MLETDYLWVSTYSWRLGTASSRVSPPLRLLRQLSTTTQITQVSTDSVISLLLSCFGLQHFYLCSFYCLFLCISSQIVPRRFFSNSRSSPERILGLWESHNTRLQRHDLRRLWSGPKDWDCSEGYQQCPGAQECGGDISLVAINNLTVVKLLV